LCKAKDTDKLKTPFAKTGMSVRQWNRTSKKSVWEDERNRFEEIVLPHLNAAYNLARWLTRNEHDAEDIVQESYLRALNSFGGFQPDSNGRAWLLKIVRNTWYTWTQKNRVGELITDQESAETAVATTPDPEMALLKKANSELVRRALEEISPAYREALILRELEGFSYKEIASIIDAPLGTVMSRLSRARGELHARLCNLLRATETRI
jgi:RNA polymerase sigma-70 factor (ECF subfamily)